MDISLRCTCGAVTGTARDVEPDRGNHLICMCDDCQAYAHHLGRASELLDVHGGTRIFQLAPSQLELAVGRQHLRCLRLSPKGLLRWYADCCKTPLGNSVAWPRVPFVGVPVIFMEFGTESEETGALGPVLARLFGSYCHGERPADAHDKVPPRIVARVLRQAAVGLVRGRHRPSPFFSDGRPAVEPVVISLEERKRARALARQAPAA